MNTSTPRPISNLNSLLTIIRIQATKTMNSITAMWTDKRRLLNKDEPRIATGRKPRSGPILAAFFFAIFMLNAVFLSHSGINNLQNRLGPDKSDASLEISQFQEIQNSFSTIELALKNIKQTPEETRKSIIKYLDLIKMEIPASLNGKAFSELSAEEKHRELKNAFDSSNDNYTKLHRQLLLNSFNGNKIREENLKSNEFLHGITLITTLLFIFSVTGALGTLNKDLGKLDYGFEWLLSLPISIPIIYGAKVLERTFLNFSGWVLFGAFYGTLFWYWQYGWIGIIIATLLTLLTNFMIAITQFSFEILFRRLFSIYFIKNIQVVCLIISSLSLLFAMSIVSPLGKTHYFIYEWIHDFGSILEILPHGILLGIFQRANLTGNIHILLIQILFAAVVGILFIKIASSQILEVINTPYKSSRSSPKVTIVQKFPGLIHKEILLLLRDRAMLIQITITPLIIICFQLLFSQHLLNKIINNSTNLAAFALGVGLYTFNFSVLQTINHEQNALWILYTTPQSLAKTVLQKSTLWIILAIAYSVTVLSIGLSYADDPSQQNPLSIAWIVSGVVICGFIGLSLGILGSDPLAREAHHKIRIDFIYMFMLISALFTSGIYLPGIWNKLVVLTIFTSLSIALWQKASQRIDYMLDPTELPPRTVDLSDGLISVVMFFFIQITLGIMLQKFGLIASAVLSYTAAATLTVIIVISTLARHGVRIKKSIRILGIENKLQNLINGVLCGIIVGSIGFIYLNLKPFIPHFKDLKLVPGLNNNLWIILLAVIIAPIFEEIIFRGLVYNGLKQNVNKIYSIILSAALFAIVHHPLSAPPVFCVGLATAFIYEKTGAILAPILTHATYNGIVILSSIALI
ncbi:MAG: CPBP family intramembrane metalloprotease [Planctomycetes bacterium]|nr:CPBP family intramembrane metalloprotease [Planctomycetota bacterium]